LSNKNRRLNFFEAGITRLEEMEPTEVKHEPQKTPGALLSAAHKEEKPLQVVGVINAFAAMMAERAGFKAIYPSGAVLANAFFGLPDLGMTALSYRLPFVYCRVK
jgi:methylisocitrate lyase